MSLTLDTCCQSETCLTSVLHSSPASTCNPASLSHLAVRLHGAAQRVLCIPGHCIRLIQDDDLQQQQRGQQGSWVSRAWERFPSWA